MIKSLSMTIIDLLFSRFEFPWGEARIVTSPQGLRSLDLHWSPDDAAGAPLRESSRSHRPIHAELNAYVRGRLSRFTVPLDPQGTLFQRAVWRALSDIPLGATRSYGEIAAAIGRPQAARAVGAACHANPIGIIVPCHRVVGADGALTGYAGGLDLKARLLAHEQISLARHVA